MMLLLQGKRGLFCSDNKRIYFPDRSWSDAKECLIDDFKILRDKETYAFIKGTPIITEDICVIEVPNFNPQNIYKETYIGDSKVILYQDDAYMRVFYKEAGVVKESRFLFNTDMRILYAKAVLCTVDLMNYIKDKCVFDSEDKVYEALFRLMRNLSNYESASEILVLDDTFIYLTKHYKYSDMDFSEIFYMQNGELDSLGVDADEFRRKSKKVKKYSVADIGKLMVEYGVCANAFASDVGFSDNLVRFSIDADNFHATVYAFKAKSFSFDYYNSDESKLEREIVKQSIDMYNSQVKAIGKSLSSKTAVQFLNKINIRKYMTKSEI